MAKRVGIAALKAHLSKHLRSVRRGEVITVLDNGTAVAEIVPLRAPAVATSRLRLRAASGLVSELELPPAPRRKVESASHLAAEREDRS